MALTACCFFCFLLSVVGAYRDPETSIDSIFRRHDGAYLSLVMSDEFNQDGRSFARGKDMIFEALEKPDDTNQAMQYYNSSTEYVTTKDGSLQITTRAIKSSWIEWDDGKRRMVERTKNYTSGMIQSWNKFCFTGGVLELSIELPGPMNGGGLWPAAWLMGNLARATFEKSTLSVWPWSYDQCGLIPHLETKQEISACDEAPGYGMNSYQGRGAPEIDIFEVMPGLLMPGHSKPTPAFMSTSLQVSPGLPKTCRPKNGYQLNSSFTWYEGLRVGPGQFNYGFWGAECGPEKDDTPEKIHKYMEDAVSVNTDLKETHFQSPHVYRVEWQPGPFGYLDWYLDDDFLFGIDAQSLQDLTGSMIPQEPMYMILNTAISHRWGMPEPCDPNTCSVCWHCYDCTNPECQCTLPEALKNCSSLPAHMKIDYIRLYQDIDDPLHSIGCSSEEFPTATFIQEHPLRYADWVPHPPPGPASVMEWMLTTALAVSLVLSVIFSATYLYPTLSFYFPRVEIATAAGHTPIPSQPDSETERETAGTAPPPTKELEMGASYATSTSRRAVPPPTENTSLLP